MRILGGKKPAWDTWKAFEDITTTFLTLSTGPDEVSNEDVATLERFTILLYDRTSGLMSIDEARKQLFTKKGRAMDAIPPPPPPPPYKSSSYTTCQKGSIPGWALLG